MQTASMPALGQAVLDQQLAEEMRLAGAAAAVRALRTIVKRS
jgi:hypothetical protein